MWYNQIMDSRIKKLIIAIIIIIALFKVPALFDYLKVNTGPEFAVYLASSPKTYKGLKNIRLENFQLEKEPLITEADIGAYDFQEGVIYFDPARKVFDSEKYLKMIGRVFVVCVGEERVFYGTVWTYAIAHGPGTIMIVPSEQGGIKFEPGYFGTGKGFETLIHSDIIRARLARIMKLR